MQGIWTAIVTPFTRGGELDLRAFDALIDAQKASGIRGVVVIGSTGEGLTLTQAEKLTLLQRAVSRGKPELEIMSGTGTLSTAQTVEFAKLALDSGVDSLLIVTPPYSKPSTAGLLQHFQAVAAAVSVPICLYHIPGRTGQKLTIEQFRQLSAIPALTAIKEAGADMAFYTEIVLATGKIVLSGDDLSFLPSLAAGGEGCVSVLSNIFPRAVQAMYDAYCKGDNSRALAYHQCLFPLMQALFIESNPAPIKALLAQEHAVLENVLRLPLASLSAANTPTLEKIYRTARQQLQNLAASFGN